MKLLKRLITLIIIAVIGGLIYLNTAFKGDAASYASQITGTQVGITGVTFAPWNNSVSLHGLDIGNPRGFKSKNAIELGGMYTNIDFMSLLSDKITVNQVKLTGAKIYYEVGISGDNIRKLVSNVKSNTASSSSDSSDKELLIKDLHITNSQLILAANLFGLKEDTKVAISDIHLTNVSSKNGGDAVARKVADKLAKEISRAVLKQKAEGYLNKVGGSLGKNGGKIVDGLKGLF